MSQREQVLVVPVMHLEDVRKNITETANAGADVDSLTFTDIQTFTENNEDEYENSVKYKRMLKLHIFKSFSLF